MGFNQPGGFDRTRGYGNFSVYYLIRSHLAIGKKEFTLERLEEAYTTENWLVRIYKVVHDPNRPAIKYQSRQIKTKTPSLSKKVRHSVYTKERMFLE